MQSVHESELALGATVPAGQGEGADEPARHMLPAGQAWQPDCAARPDALPNEPLAHRATVGAPWTQKPPMVHSSQAVLPASSWYLPASQLAHVPWPAAGCTVPALQSV